ncbi:MAG: hypothetical protein ACJ751_11790 [Niastella sp.]
MSPGNGQIICVSKGYYLQ